MVRKRGTAFGAVEKWESRWGCGISKGRWRRWETGVWLSPGLHGPAFSTALRELFSAGWANLAGGCVAADNMWPIADRYAPVQMLMDGHRAAGQRAAKPALLQLPVAIRNRNGIVLGHHTLGLNCEDPVQVGACGAPECGSLLCRGDRELLVESRYILLAEKLVGALDGRAMIGIGVSLTAPPLPHHRTCGSASGGSAG